MNLLFRGGVYPKPCVWGAASTLALAAIAIGKCPSTDLYVDVALRCHVACVHHLSVFTLQLSTYLIIVFVHNK